MDGCYLALSTGKNNAILTQHEPLVQNLALLSKFGAIKGSNDLALFLKDFKSHFLGERVCNIIISTLHSKAGRLNSLTHIGQWWSLRKALSKGLTSSHT